VQQLYTQCHAQAGMGASVVEGDRAAVTATTAGAGIATTCKAITTIATKGICNAKSGGEHTWCAGPSCGVRATPHRQHTPGQVQPAAGQQPAQALGPPRQHWSVRSNQRSRDAIQRA